MKRLFAGLFMILALSSFVFAASSSVVTNFTVDVQSGEVTRDIPTESFSGDYLEYIILAIIVLAWIYFTFKKKGARKKSSKRKSSKRKKASKSKK